MGTLQAVYYRASDGQEPVRDFIEELDVEAQAAIDNQVERLNILSDEIPHLPFPHSSQVDGELRELRCHYGRSHYRVLSRRSGRLIVLLHVFAKRSAKIPRREIETAQERWADFKGADGHQITSPASSRGPRRAVEQPIRHSQYC